jgi:hypothetical protein
MMKIYSLFLFLIITQIAFSQLINNRAKILAPNPLIKSWRAGSQSIEDIKSITTDQFGNAIVVGGFETNTIFGNTALTSNGSYDIFIVKYSPSGAVIWAKGYGGTGFEVGNSVDCDPQGNIYITGNYYGYGNFGGGEIGSTNGMQNGFIAKYTNNGDYLWSNKIGSNRYVTSNKICVDNNGNAYICGAFNTNMSFTSSINLTTEGSQDIFISKYNIHGECIWAKTAFGYTEEEALGICLDNSQNNLVVTGYFRTNLIYSTSNTDLSSAGMQDIFIGKINLSTTQWEWIKSIGSATWDMGLDVTASQDNHYYMTGYYNDPDVLATKFDENGAIIWLKTGGGLLDDMGFGIKIDGDGLVNVAGRFTNTMKFGTGQLMTCNGATDAFILKLDPLTGDNLWQKQIGGTDYEQIVSMAKAPNGNIFTTGYFFKTFSIDSENLVFSGQRDFFVNYLYNENTPLSVDLLTFEATKFEETTNLTWKTANEENFSHFELTRSNNSKEFVNIGRVESNGKGGLYNFTDNNPTLEATNYYRLKMIDNDGTAKLSKIVSVRFDKKEKYLIVENPANNGEFIAITNVENPNFNMVNALGKKVDISFNAIANHKYAVKVKSPVVGVYFLVLEVEGCKVLSRKVLVP